MIHTICMICDKVAREGLFDYGEVTSTGFKRSGFGSICEECYWWHEDTMSDFNLEDELDHEEDDLYDYDV